MAQRLNLRTNLTWIIALTVVLLGVAVVGVGAGWAYRAQKALIRKRTQQTLETIIYFQTQGVKEWCRQSIHDAQGVSNSPEIQVISSLSKEPQPQRETAAREALRLFAIKQGFVAWALLDSEERPLPWSIGGDRRYLHPACAMLEPSDPGEPRMSPLHDCPSVLPHLDILVPIVDKPSGGVSVVVLFAVNPWPSLFRKMITAPKVLPSLDTYLVQRVYGKIEYLTPLQGGTIPPLAFRTPCVQRANLDDPSYRALLGDIMTGEGIDYRGVPVVFATNYVPWTSWGVVGTLDEDEAYASLRLTVLLAGVLSALALLTAVTVVYARWSRRHARATAELATELSAQKDTLQTMVRKLFSAQLEERRRISLDIHDGLAQSLGSARLALQEVESEQPSGAAFPDRESILHARTCIEAAELECRALLRTYRPSDLDRLGLLGAIRALATSPPTPVVRFSPRDEKSLLDLPPEISLVLYHLAQEALANVRKHSNATSAEVRLCVDDGCALLEIEDNGQGFQLDQQPQPLHFGLDCMQERARSVGGTLIVESQPGKGTHVVARLPMKPLVQQIIAAPSGSADFEPDPASLAPPPGE